MNFSYLFGIHGPLRMVIVAATTVIGSAILGHYCVVEFLRGIGFELDIDNPQVGFSTAKWIGILERTIVTCFVIAGAISASIFLFAVKGALMGLRLRRSDPKKVEYMLVGTLASYLIAILFGFLANALR